MNHLRLHFFLISLMSLVATPVFADETKAILPEKEEDIPVEFIPTLDTTISVGLRRLNNGPRVRFGNLGSMAQPITGASHDTGSSFTGHNYTDGYVAKDAVGTYEMNDSGTGVLANGESSGNTVWKSKNVNGVITVYTSINTAMLTPVTDSNGNITYVPLTNSDGTYIPNTNPVNNSDGTVSQVNSTILASTAKFLAYNANRARTWGVLNPKQIHVLARDSVTGNVTSANVEMHADGVVSAGASLEADSSGSTGFDISVERRLGKRGHFEWGVAAGCEFSYINAKASGVFPAYLLRTTDVYTLFTGFAGKTIDRTQPGGNATDLTYQDFNNPGSTVYRYTDTSTVPTKFATGADDSQAAPIDLTNVQWGTAQIAGTVMIHGNYQLKGAYLLGRVGPTFRYNFNERWAISGTAGLALAWVGSNFRATEFYNTKNDLPPALQPDYEENATEYHNTMSSATHKFTPGVYFDLNLEYWVTDRTGFYAGITGQKIRTYNQSRLGDWTDTENNLRSGVTATVDMGKNVGWTLGIRTRF